MQCLSNMWRNIRRKKGMHLDCTKSEMKRCIGTWTLSALAIGNILGCGLYIVTADVTHIAGPSAVISYIVAGIAAFIISLCFSEFAIRFPKAGSVYYYSYVAFGELCAFVAGWNASFEKLVSCAAVAKAQSNFINYVTDSAIKNFTIRYVLNDRAWDHPVVADYPDFLASFIIFSVCIILALGTQLSSRVSTAFVVINASVIFTILSAGVYYADVSRWSDNGGFFPHGARGSLLGVAACFWVYTGFDDITSYSEELLNPARSIPIATLIGICATGVINTAVVLVITMVQHYQDIKVNSMLTSVFTSHGNTWISIVIGIGVMTTVATIIVTHSAVARIIQNMAADGLVFKSLAHIDKRTAVPARSTLFLGLVCGVMAMFFDVIKLVEFSVLGALSAYIITSIGVIILRYREPEVDKNDKQPTTSYNSSNAHTRMFTRRNNTSPTSMLPKKKLNIYHPKYCTELLLENHSVEFVATYCVLLIVIFVTVISVVAIHFQSLLWTQPQWCVVVLMTFLCFATVSVFSILAHCEELNIPNGYKVPMTPYFPMIAVIINIIFILLLKPVTWICFVFWNGLGLLVYILYGYRNSIEGLKNARDERTPLLNNNVSRIRRQSSQSSNICHSSYESTI